MYYKIINSIYTGSLSLGTLITEVMAILITVFVFFIIEALNHKE